MSAIRFFALGGDEVRASARPRHGSPLSRFARGIGRAPRRFVTTLHAAQVVARHADHYFAMSDPQLARAGLSRESVPAELLHELDERQSR